MGLLSVRSWLWIWESLRDSNEFLDMMAEWGESKRLELKFGSPQLQQCQEMEVLASALYTFLFMSRHFWCIQVSHESHWMALWFLVQAWEHTPHGNLAEAGPGFVSRSPDSMRRGKSQLDDSL